MTYEEIEKEIRDRFEENYQMLRLEGGHALTSDVKAAALDQVIMYYKKLKSIANKVTQTEVKLTLANQRTPQKRRFTIEGIVDIVTEDDKTTMYDIKTHEPDVIKANKPYYEKQLNIYAYIWENLQKNSLNETAVISTVIPPMLRQALENGPQEWIDMEMEKWEPVIPIDLNHDKVADTIEDFAKVVDSIENRDFESPSLDYLNEKIKGTNVAFASRTCRNCDGRFSCPAYREYALQSGVRTNAEFRRYFERSRDEIDQEDFITANIDMDRLETLQTEREGGVKQ